MKKQLFSALFGALCCAAGAGEVIFPDGSTCKTEALPGHLISGNGGTYGDFYRPCVMKPGMCSAVFDSNHANRLLIWADRGTKKYSFEFPDSATLQEIQILYSAGKDSQLVLFVSDDGKKWQIHHRAELPAGANKFMRIPIAKVTSRYFGLGNAGKIRHSLHEAWLWGSGKEQPAAKQSGILPQMLAMGDRKVILPVLKQEINAKNFTPEMLKDFRKLDLFILRQTTRDQRASLFAAMVPGGIALVHRRDDAKFRLSHYEIACNRTDLAMNNYYYFVGYPTGKSRTDASRVIDPTPSGKPFNSTSFRKKAGDIYYDVIMLPLANMTKEGNYHDYQWSFSFVGLYRDEQKRPVRLSFPSLRAIHAPMLFSVLEAKREGGSNFEFQSFEGMDRTYFTRSRFEQWRNAPGVKGKKTVLVRTNLEQGVVSQPVLPLKGINENVSLQMSRNELENLFFFAVNPQNEKAKMFCSFAGFRDAAGKEAAGLSAEIGVVGVVSRRAGTMLHPVFTPDNMPGKVFFNQYIRNSSVISAFPELSLRPGETAALALRVRSSGAAPGRYQGVFRCGESAVNVTVNVTKTTLERPQEVWNNGHARLSSPMLLIKGKDYAVREAQYYYDCGINVFPINPVKNPEGVAELYKRIPNLIFYFRNNASFNTELRTGRINPQTWTPAKAAAIVKEVLALRDSMLKAGWLRRQFFISLMDEPGVDNTAWGYGKIAEALKKADPALQLYCNPCCWTRGGFAAADDIVKAYSSWYKLMDISYPIAGLYYGWGSLDVKKLRKMWDAPRRFNGTYIHPYPGRIQPWRAFFAGQNAWGYYSMYQPSSDAWNDFDRSSMDYQTLYPGVNAPIFTLQSEQSREAWEDYLMLLALKKQNGNAALLKKLEKSIKDTSLLTTRPGESFWDARRTLMLDALNR